MVQQSVSTVFARPTFRFSILSLLAVSFVSLISCGSPALLMRETLPPQDIRLVTIDDTVVIFASTLIERLELSGKKNTAWEYSWSAASDTLEFIIDDSLVSRVVDTFDLDLDQAGANNYKHYRIGVLQSEFYERIILPRVTVDSASVQTFYEKNPKAFTGLAAIDCAHIVLSTAGYRGGKDSEEYQDLTDEELDGLVLRRLRYLKDNLVDSLTFQEAAVEYSLDRNTGEKGGRFGWKERYFFHPELEQVLYDTTTPLHTALGPLVSRDGVHLFYIYDRQFEGVQPLKGQIYELAQQYAASLIAQKEMRVMLDSVGSLSPVVYNDSALTLSSKEGAPDLWVAWAPGVDTVRFQEYTGERLKWLAAYPRMKSNLEFCHQIATAIVEGRRVLLMCEDLGVLDIPEVEERLREGYRRFSRVAIMRQGAGIGFAPDPENVRRYYDMHPEEFLVERPLYIQQLIVSDSMQGEYLRALLESGEDILKLAEEYYPGEPSIRRTAADLGYLGPRDFDSTIYAIAMHLGVGKVTHPIKTQYGYHVVKVVDFKTSKDFNKAKGEIVIRLTEDYKKEEFRRWREELRANHRIKLSAPLFSGVKVFTKRPSPKQ